MLSDPLDYLDEFVSTVTLASGQTNQLPSLGNEEGLFGGIAHHGDTSSSAELQKPFVSQDAKSTEHGVGVDAEYRRQILGRWQALSG